MKKVLTLIVIISLFIFMPVVKAENFSTFSIRANFSNEVNVTYISGLYVMLDIPGHDDLETIELNNENMFYYTSKDIPNNTTFDSAYVKGDKVGRYSITGEIKNNTSVNSATLYLTIRLNNRSTTTTTTTTTTKKVVEDDDIIIVDDDGNVKTTDASEEIKTVVLTSTNTTLSAPAQNRMRLYKYLLIVVGVLVGIVLLMIAVKAIRTANLM
jgi:hypothetical protein